MSRTSDRTRRRGHRRSPTRADRPQFVSAVGTDWSCADVGQDVTCVHADPIGADARGPTSIELRRQRRPGRDPVGRQHGDGRHRRRRQPGERLLLRPANVRAIDLTSRRPTTRRSASAARASTTSTCEHRRLRDRQRRRPSPTRFRPASLRRRDRHRLELRAPSARTSPAPPTGRSRGEAAPTIELVVDVGAARAAERRQHRERSRRPTTTTRPTTPPPTTRPSPRPTLRRDQADRQLLTAESTGRTCSRSTTRASTPTTGRRPCQHDPARRPLRSSAPRAMAGPATRARESSPASTPIRSRPRSAGPGRRSCASRSTATRRHRDHHGRVSTADDRNPDNDTASDTDLRHRSRPVGHSSHTGRLPRRRHGDLRARRRQRRREPTTRAGPITVTDTLPAGLNFDSAAGPGWSCGEAAGVVTCTRTAEVDVGGSAPDSRSTSGRQRRRRPAGDQPGLRLDRRRPRSRQRRRLRRDEVEMIDLAPRSSIATAPRSSASEVDYQWPSTTSATRRPSGPARVTDTLPTGITPNAASGRAGTCSITGQDVVLRSRRVLAASEQAASDDHGDVSSNAGTAPSRTGHRRHDGRREPGQRLRQRHGDVVRIARPEVTIDDQLPQIGSFRVGGEVAYLVSVLNQGGSPTTAPTDLDRARPRASTSSPWTGPGRTARRSGRLVDCLHVAGFDPGDRIDLIVQAVNRRPPMRRSRTPA